MSAPDRDDIRSTLEKYEAALWEDLHEGGDEAAARLEDARKALMALLRRALSV